MDSTRNPTGSDGRRPHPRGGAPALIAALLALFPGSAALGVGLAGWLAPGSWVAQMAGFFALPMAFVAGLQMWIGAAIFGAIVRLLFFRGATPPAGARTEASLPGSFVFLPLSSGAGLLAGVVVGLVPAAESWPGAVAVFWLVGTLHGWVAWRLAKRGVLVPPDSM